MDMLTSRAAESLQEYWDSKPNIKRRYNHSVLMFVPPSQCLNLLGKTPIYISSKNEPIFLGTSFSIALTSSRFFKDDLLGEKMNVKLTFPTRIKQLFPFPVTSMSVEELEGCE